MALIHDVAPSALRKNEVEAKCKASRMLRDNEGYAGMDELGITRVSLGTGTWAANKGVTELELELALLKLWYVNGAGNG